MSTVMTECTNEPGILALQWNWRLAQQAFAAVVDRGVPTHSMLIEQASHAFLLEDPHGVAGAIQAFLHESGDD